jgi:hypothetical protein
MVKDFFIKKENIFIVSVALISITFIVIGFSFLFLKPNSYSGPRTIPNTVEDIVWTRFQSKFFETQIEYPEYMYIAEQKEEIGVGITLAEFKPREFLTYFSNQNHVSMYPDGIDNQLFYGKTKKSEYVSKTGQVFAQTEYLTLSNEVWGVLLVPQKTPKYWQPRGFIWIQTHLANKESLCISSGGIVINNIICDPYKDELPVYRGTISGDFLEFGYEIINKNSF